MIRFGINTTELESTISLIGRVLGIRVTFFDAAGAELKLRSLRKMTRYCMVRRREKGFDARCFECDRIHLEAARASRKIQIYRCHDRLIEGIIPLYDKNGIYLGSIVFGQIRDVSLKRKDLAERLGRLYSQLPSYSIAKADEIGTLLKYVSEYIIHSEIIKRKNFPWADKAESYIGANIGKRISIAAIAKHSGYSASFIHHRFKADFGMPPAKYVLGRKMKSAREKLLDGKSVGETAAELGFYDLFHFSKAFKKYFGHSPSAARMPPDLSGFVGQQIQN
ncbi:MAG: helix-turn-helix domain-containing protein [Victivallales bacterium]